MKKFVILISVLAIALVCLISCNGGTEAETTASEPADTAESELVTEETAELYETTAAETTAPETTEAELETEEERTMFTFSKKNEVKYALDASADVAEGNADDLAYLKNAVKAMSGADFPATAERTISIRLEEDNLNYSVTLDETSGNISVAGGSKEAVQRAIYTLTSMLCAGANNGEKQISSAINYVYDYSVDKIDNSSLLSYISTDKVKLIEANDAGLATPEWAESLVMVEIRPDTASIGGTLPECYDLVDFYASIGVNGFWIVPIYKRGTGGNGYGNCGPHTLEPAIVGTDDTEEGWQVVKAFVDYAHSKGIYVFFDVVTWGVMKGSELTVSHPEWFSGEAWGNAAFNWNNAELLEWFTQTLVENIEKTGADGFRCDCEPNYTGYKMYLDVRQRLVAKGKYIIIISEDGNTRRATYDFEQDGVLDYGSMSRGELYQKPVNFFVDGYLNIVDTVKTGKGLGIAYGQNNPVYSGNAKYYTNCITNHDYQRRDVSGNRLNIGYSAIYAPFIPLWYMGDEFNAQNPPAVLYDMSVDYSEAETNANTYFLEDVKQMIKIRRENKDIFEYWADNHRDSNICEVKAEGFDSLQNYARYKDGKAVLVVANNNADSSGFGTITVPLAECVMDGHSVYKITDMLTGKTVVRGSADEIASFTAAIPYRYMGVYLVEILK